MLTKTIIFIHCNGKEKTIHSASTVLQKEENMDIGEVIWLWTRYMESKGASYEYTKRKIVRKKQWCDALGINWSFIPHSSISLQNSHFMSPVWTISNDPNCLSCKIPKYMSAKNQFDLTSLNT